MSGPDEAIRQLVDHQQQADPDGERVTVSRQALEEVLAAVRSSPPTVLIWSEEHRAWWNPNSCGYTNSMRRAGVYTVEQADLIVRSANHGSAFNEVAVPITPEIAAAIALPSSGR